MTTAIAEQHTEADYWRQTLTPNEAAARLKCRTTKFYELLDINGGPLRSKKRGRARLVSELSLIQYVMSLPEGPDSREEA